MIKWREKKNKAAQQLAYAGERLNTIPMNLSLRGGSERNEKFCGRWRTIGSRFGKRSG